MATLVKQMYVGVIHIYTLLSCHSF